MPFFNDIEVDPDVQRGPFWGTFATLREQVERLVAVNIAWSLQLLPAILALAFPELPLWVRIPMLLYSTIAIAPATAVLYALILRAVRREPINMPLAQEVIRDMALPGIRALGPLLGILVVLFWTAISLAGLGVDTERPAYLLVVNVLIQLLLLLGLVSAVYWGPILAEDPSQSMIGLLRQSLRKFWRYPGRTVMVAVAVVLTLFIGFISIGGLMLIVPVIVALLQTHMYMMTTAKR